MDIADKITNISNAIYRKINKGQANYIVAPSRVTDFLFPLRYTIGDYKIEVDKENLLIFSVYENGLRLVLDYDLKNSIEPEEITEDIYVGAIVDRDYKIVMFNVDSTGPTSFQMVHHYVKLHMPDLFNKYKLLYNGEEE